MAAPLATITEAAAALRAGVVSSRELTSAALRRADVLDPQLGAYARRFDDEALAAAERADRELAAGHDLGPLHDIPVAVKDVIASQEGPTTAQSRVVESTCWVGRDAPAVRRLRRAGAVITGKLTTMEFAIGMPDRDAPFPLPRNPWNLHTWPGGSSSGAAAATAAGLIFAGLGTDTGGSIRIPAAFCGVTGLMPTLGRVPRSGVVPLGYSLDRVGPIARSARDCATVLTAIAGHHPSDTSSSTRSVPDLDAESDPDLTGLRIGVAWPDTGARAHDPAVATQLDAVASILTQAGARVCDVRLPYYAEGLAAARITMLVEALAHHRANLAARAADYAASTRYVIAQGSLIPGADYVQAQRVRRAVQTALTETFEHVDAVIMPTCATGAPEYSSLLDRVNAIADVMAVVFTTYWNAVAHPVIALPMGFTASGLPLSVQVAGKPFDEATIVRVADAVQQRTNWHLRVPPPQPPVSDHPAVEQNTATAAVHHDRSADAVVRSALARMSVALPDAEIELLANDVAPLAALIDILRNLDAAEDLTPALEFQTHPSRPPWW